MTAPFRAAWNAETQTFHPLRRFVSAVADEYSHGQVITLAEQAERSDATHNHEFAWLAEAYRNLPEDIAADYPNVETLRKRALIATGWCHIRDYACSSRAEAQRWAAHLRAEADPYAVVIPRDDVVRVCTAKSQAKNRMKAGDFQKSKTDILNYVAGLIGVEPAKLAEARAA